MVYHLSMVRSEASYQSFTGSIYGLMYFITNNIKVASKVKSNGIVTLTKFICQKFTAFLIE